MLTLSKKRSLIQQSVANVETYMFNPSAVATGKYLLKSLIDSQISIRNLLRT